MATGLKATISGKRLADCIAIPAEAWQQVGSKLRQNIQWRTRLGNDADGHAFEPYAEGYAAYRKKHGWSTGRVTLRTGRAGSHMLDDITFVTQATTNPRVTLFFASAAKAEIAQYHMGEGRVDRLFFKLSPQDLDEAVDILRRAWTRR